MTARGLYTLLFGLLMMVTSLSVGSSGAFLMGAAALIALAFSLICVPRGSVCRYTLSAHLPLPLPIAPVSLRVTLPSGRQSEFLLRTRLFGMTQSDNEFSCPHVGVYSVGAVRATYADCFGLFSLSMIAPPS